MKNPYKVTKQEFKNGVLWTMILSAIIISIVNKISFAIEFISGISAYLIFMYFYNIKTLKPVRNYRSPVVDFNDNQGKTPKQLTDSVKMIIWTFFICVIFLLGFALCSKAQTPIDTNAFVISFPENSKPILKVYDKSGNMVVESDSQGNIINHCITLQDLIDYQKVCYDDSFQVEVFIDPNHRYELSPGVWVTTLMGGGYYQKQWSHRQLIIDERFIEFMKTKNK
jgi:hypothetical protein